nr:hypothetical protein [uncultured Flavobacterium sp.]
MIRFIEISQLTLIPIIGIAFIVMLILGGVINLNYPNEKIFEHLFSYKIGKAALIILIVGFITLFSLNTLKNKLIRNEIIEFVANPKNITIIINGKIDYNFNATEIRKIKDENDRNTGEPKIEIILSSKNKTYPLTLIRSYQNKNQYWVFSSKHSSTEKNCIGEINTTLLNAY